MSHTVHVTCIVAADVKVTAFDQQWLISQGVLPADEKDDEGFFTPIAIQQSCSKLDLLIIPGRVQIQGKGNTPTAACEVVRSAMISLLRHAPSGALALSAIGLNFVYNYALQQKQFAERNIMFLPASKELTKFFPADSSRFGFRAMAYHILRSTLTVNPMADSDGEERVQQCSFNFHRETISVSDAVEHLERASEFHSFSSKCSQGLFESSVAEGVAS
jgi:hypothetical protein